VDAVDEVDVVVGDEVSTQTDTYAVSVVADLTLIDT
jgi:hypothetical protein